MNERENLLSLLSRKGYERAPVHFGMCPSLVNQFEQRTGTREYGEFFGFPMENIVIPLPKDYKIEDFQSFYSDYDMRGAVYNPFGIAHVPGSAEAMHMKRLVHPLRGTDSLERVKEYPFYDYSDIDIAKLKCCSDEIKSRGKASCGHMAATIWETAWGIRSMEDLMVDLLEENEIGEYIINKVFETQLKKAEAFAAADVDFIWLGDDVGMQHSIMISEDMYRTILKPRMKKIIQAARAIKPSVKIIYHSCGYVIPFIEDYIEEGIDVLNPVQPECMDFKDVFEQFGGRISFWGTIGTQTTMPFGTEHDVRDMVKRNLDIAGEYGGLLCAPTHLLEPEVPLENVFAYVDACKNYK